MSETERDRPEQIVKDVSQEGISDETRLRIYDDWSTTYDQDLESIEYTAPRVTAQTVGECFPENREDKVIIDIAAGTGLAGQELYKLGFRTMDALDPSQQSLDVAKKKSVYRNFICNYITEKPSNIPENSYDALTICGGMGNGHMPCGALYEMIRLVKPGGFIVIVTREEHLVKVKEYKVRFDPLVEKLVADGKWRKVKREIFPNYLLGLNGLCMVYQIC